MISGLVYDATTAAAGGKRLDDAAAYEKFILYCNLEAVSILALV